MADDEYGGGVEGRVKLLSERVEFVVGFVEAPFVVVGFVELVVVVLFFFRHCGGIPATVF